MPAWGPSTISLGAASTVERVAAEEPEHQADRREQPEEHHRQQTCETVQPIGNARTIQPT